MTKEDLLYDIKTAKKEIRNIECLYQAVYDATYKYMQASGNWDLQEAFDDFVDDEWIEEAIKDQMEEGGFERVWFLVSGIKQLRDIYKVDVYGNLENITKKDVELLIEDIKERLEDINAGEDNETEDD